jgi:hypothetical protein
MQINPPFDRSPPCPACQRELAGMSALIHNFLNRCDVHAGQIREGKAFVKLWDLRHTTIPDELTVPHPASEELVAVARALIEATDGMTCEGLSIKWPPEVRERVEVLIERAAKASDAFAEIFDAHTADERHYSGRGGNIIRERQGSTFAGHWHKKSYAETSYHYTVEVVDSGGDLTHTVCGTHLKLHDHFKANLAKDPTFYSHAWCPKCRIDAPIHQFGGL